MCQLSWNLWASNSWNPQGLSRPVMRLLYLFNTLLWRSRNSVDGIQTRLRAEQPGFRILPGQSFSPKSRPDRLRNPPGLLFGGYRGSFLEIKRLERDVDPSPPSCAELKKVGAISLLALRNFQPRTETILPLNTRFVLFLLHGFFSFWNPSFSNLALHMSQNKF